MTTIVRIRVLLVVTVLAAACTTPAAPPPTTVDASTPAKVSDQDAIATANEFFEALIAGDYARATNDFDDTMKAALPESELKATWESLVAQAGAYQERVGTQTIENVDRYKRVVITLMFETVLLDMRVVIDTESGLIGGLFFAPNQDTSQQYAVPEYVDPESFREQEVTVGSGEWELPGILTIPNGQGPFPAVVLVHGSGPNDRDETVGANKPFKDIAWGLASRGIAVLRYDKRTRVHADKLASLADGITVKEETTDDALAAVDLLRQTEGIEAKRVFVLGHSLGGMLAPRIAEADREIAGLIIMAGPTRPLEDLIVEQTQYILSLSGEVSVQEQRQVEAIQQEATAIKALEPSIDVSAKYDLLGAPPQYWLDLQGYNPAVAASTLPQPMLILQGERDYQVTLIDFQGWVDALSGRSDVLLKSYSNLNHLFISGAGQSSPEEYQTPGNVAAMVIDDLANWISAQP